MNTRRKILLFGLFCLLGIVGGVANRHLTAVERTERTLKAVVPLGSSRQQVKDYLETQSAQIAAFEYPLDDPRHGTTLLASIRPPLSFRTVRILFVFDQEGAEGKPVRCEVEAAEE